MPSRARELSETPVNLVQALDLTQGARYILQNVGERPLRLVEQAGQPDPSVPAHVIPAVAVGAIESSAATVWTITVGRDGIWCWGSTTIVVGDA